MKLDKAQKIMLALTLVFALCLGVIGKEYCRNDRNNIADGIIDMERINKHIKYHQVYKGSATAEKKIAEPLIIPKFFN